ncbi:MAG: response regulator [Synergistes sp.]|nr:response regulator [Synergistes sp.]
MKKKVIIAEDSVYMRALLKEILIKNGYDVVAEAENGSKAVSLYDELEPDVITLDITMPEKDGLSALKEIKSSHPEARVVMACTINQQTQVIEAIRAGASDFFIKPMQSERVLEAIEKALK